MTNWKFLIMWIANNWQLTVAGGLFIGSLHIFHKLNILKNRERELFMEMMEREREWKQVINKISSLYDQKIFFDKNIKDSELEEIENLIANIETEREDRIGIGNYDFIYDLEDKIDEFKKEYPNFFKQDR